MPTLGDAPVRPCDNVMDGSRKTGAEMIRVLLVEDHADFRRAFGRLLDRQPDFEMDTAGSLTEARQKLRGVDVVLVDRGLPDGDGLELIDALHAVTPSAKVLVLSATVEATHPQQ